MQRRAFLTGLGAAALAGCSGPGTSSPAPTTTDPPSPTETPRPEPELRWAIEPLAAASEDRPARVRVAFRNVGGLGELVVEGQLPMPPVPGNLEGADLDHPRPVLLPVDTEVALRHESGCWTARVDDPDIADDEPWAWGYGEQRTVRLSAGETRTGVYHVVNSWPGSCFPPGTYRFDRAYELAGTFHKPGLALELPVDPNG